MALASLRTNFDVKHDNSTTAWTTLLVELAML
jgi:hypothetical protein